MNSKKNNPMKINWLHISDVHENKRNGDHERFARDMLHQKILSAVQEHEEQIDFIFFAGDLAFGGKHTEYSTLQDNFLTPLRQQCLGAKLYCVPGNHDVDRESMINPRLALTERGYKENFLNVGANGQRYRTQNIFPRFENYQAAQQAACSNWTNAEWLSSEEGSICDRLDHNGIDLAVIGINTAWLCHDNQDNGKLTAGPNMVRAALKKAEGAHLKIVLAHHPLSSMEGEAEWTHATSLRQDLCAARVVYLYGHQHKPGVQIEGTNDRNL
ncbi:MAG: metallophosphoesterase [Pseudomonadota bacterium]